jgi:CheY-like chemotaxis protein
MMYDGRSGGAAPGISPHLAVLGRMRHDLRTPLNAIMGYSEILLEDARRDGRAAIVDDIDRVRQGGRRLLALIDEVLRPSPLEAGEPDLGEVRRAIREGLRPLLDGVIGSTNVLLEKAEASGLTQCIPDVRRIRDAGLRLLALVEGDELAALASSTGAESGPRSDAEATRLDVVPSPPSVQPVQPAIQGAQAASLLVVDDHETNRDILSRYLQRRGHRVSTASGGRQALSLLADRPFDLVLLDIVMPDMNGYQVLQQLKADQSLSQTPVIFISALDDTLGKVQAFRAGGVDYVTKPFQAEEVIARVESQLKISRLQKDLGRQNQELLRKNEELTQAQKRTDLVFSALAEALPGTVLDGKYRLDERIGTGGFGAVFRGMHLGLNLPVAIKVFRPLPGNDTPDALERFCQEGIAASRIRHPNVVEIHDNGISSTGIAYLVMELLQGHTLAAELSDRRPLAPQRTLEILLPVCETLAEFHAAGILHRDIKPENIYLHRGRGGEVVKLLDFGLSKIWGPSGEETQITMSLGDTVVGTPAYMAPERLLNAEYDGRSDVYSLGVIMYRMLCGRAPFETDGNAKYAVAMMQLTAEPPSMSALNPSLPQGLADLVGRMLSKDPGRRPSARALSVMLKNAASSA